MRAVELERKERLRLEHEIRSIAREISEKRSSLARSLKECSDLLDLAEEEYSEGVINPFWEALESAVSHLGFFRATVETIHSNVSRFGKLCRDFGGIPCQMDAQISESVLEAATNCARRLKAINREAQKNSAFATVFAQRRNTAALIDGFGTLNSAIQGLKAWNGVFAIRSKGCLIRFNPP